MMNGGWRWRAKMYTASGAGVQCKSSLIGNQLLQLAMT
jgi:hypothetical protein